MKFFSENHSGDVNIDSGPGFFHPFQPGIHIHIASESVFTSLRNDYSHAPESALFSGYQPPPAIVATRPLRENLQAAALQLSPETIVNLDSIADTKES
jgi:hypothetical protein